MFVNSLSFSKAGEEIPFNNYYSSGFIVILDILSPKLHKSDRADYYLKTLLDLVQFFFLKQIVMLAN
jgi:hypothetical protein